MTQTLEPTATESLPLTKTHTLSQDPTEDPTLTVTHTITDSFTSDRSATPTITDEETQTLTHTITPDLTLSMSLTETLSQTEDDTMTLTQTFTPDPTMTLTPTQSRSFTRSTSNSDTITIESTASMTQSQTDERTLTRTVTKEQTMDPTKTLTQTLTNSASLTFSTTRERTEDPTKTETVTATWSKYPTFTMSLDLSSTMSHTMSFGDTNTTSETLTLTDELSRTKTKTRSAVDTISKTLDGSLSRTPSRSVEPSPSLSLSKDKSITWTYSPPPTRSRSADVALYPSGTPTREETKTDWTASETSNLTITMSKTYSEEEGPLDENGKPQNDKNRLELFNITKTLTDSNEFQTDEITFVVVVYRDMFMPNVTVGPGKDCELESDIPEKWETKGFASKYKKLKLPLTSRMLSPTLMEVKVGKFKDYAISGSENIQFYCKGSAFVKKRAPAKKLPLFTIEVPDDDPAKQFNRARSQAEAGGVVMFLIRATPLLPFAGALSGITACHNDYHPGYIVHPTQIAIGTDKEHKYFRGMLVANITITIGSGILHAILAVVLMLVKKLKFTRAAAKVRFPGLLYYVVLYFYVGSTCGAYRMLMYRRDVLSLVLGSVGALWTYLLIGAVFVIARTKPVQQMAYPVNAGDYIFQCTNKVWLIPRMKILDALFFTRAIWLNEDEDSDVRYVQRYGAPFWNFNENRVWFAWLDLIFLQMFGFVLAFYTPERLFCAYRALAILILIFIYMVLDFAFKPHHWTFHRRVSQVCLVLLVIAALLFFLHLIMGEAQSTMNDIGEIILFAVMIILMIAVFVELFGKLYDMQLRKLKNYKDPNRNNKNFVRPDEWMKDLEDLDFLAMVDMPNVPGMEKMEAAGEDCMDPKLLFLPDDDPRSTVVQLSDVRGVRLDLDTDDKKPDEMLGFVGQPRLPEMETASPMKDIRADPVLRFALDDPKPEAKALPTSSVRFDIGNDPTPQEKMKDVELKPVFKVDMEEEGDTIEVVEADEDEVQAAMALDVAFPTIRPIQGIVPSPPPLPIQHSVSTSHDPSIPPPPPPKKETVTKFATDPTEDVEMKPVAPEIKSPTRIVETKFATDPTEEVEKGPVAPTLAPPPPKHAVVTKFAVDPEAPVEHRPVIDMKPTQARANVVTKFSEDPSLKPDAPHRPVIDIKADPETHTVTKFSEDPSHKPDAPHRPVIDIKADPEIHTVTKFSEDPTHKADAPHRPVIDIKADPETHTATKFSEDPTHKADAPHRPVIDIKADPETHTQSKFSEDPTHTADSPRRPVIDIKADPEVRVAATMSVPAPQSPHPSSPHLSSPLGTMPKFDPEVRVAATMSVPAGPQSPHPSSPHLTSPLGTMPKFDPEPKAVAKFSNEPTPQQNSPHRPNFDIKPEPVAQSPKHTTVVPAAVAPSKTMSAPNPFGTGAVPALNEPKSRATFSTTDYDAELKKLQTASSPKGNAKGKKTKKKKDDSSSSSSSSDSDDDRRKPKGGAAKPKMPPPRTGTSAKLQPGKSMPKLPTSKTMSAAPKKIRDEDFL